MAFEGITNPRKRNAAREAEAYRLAVSGSSPAEIAVALDTSVTTARKLVASAAKKTLDDATVQRAVEADRLSQIHRIEFGRALRLMQDAETAGQGHEDPAEKAAATRKARRSASFAISAALANCAKVSKQRSALLGLEAPKKVDVRVAMQDFAQDFLATVVLPAIASDPKAIAQVDAGLQKWLGNSQVIEVEAAKAADAGDEVEDDEE